jgi:hypothetical protein
MTILLEKDVWQDLRWQLDICKNRSPRHQQLVERKLHVSYDGLMRAFERRIDRAQQWDESGVQWTQRRHAALWQFVIMARAVMASNYAGWDQAYSQMAAAFDSALTEFKE